MQSVVSPIQIRVPTLKALACDKIFEQQGGNPQEVNIYQPIFPRFCDVFSNESAGSNEQAIALTALRDLPVEKRATLPMFDGAHPDYIELVVDSVFADHKSDKGDKGDCFFKLINYLHEDGVPSGDRLFSIQEVDTQEPESTKAFILNKMRELNAKKAFNNIVLKFFFFIEGQSIPVNFNKFNLSGIDFSHSDLKDVNFTEANLSNVNFFKADLSHANCTKANVLNACFTKANLGYANFSEVNFFGVDLSKLRLDRIILHKANLMCANLSNVDASFVNLTEANLVQANLTGVKFNHCVELSGANLAYANLTDADFSCVTAVGADFQFATLTNAKFSSATLNKSKFNYSDMRNANLEYAKLENTDCKGADFTDANLYLTKLSNTIFDSAHLNNANLAYAEGNGADFRNSNCDGANFEYTNLSDANLNKTNFTNANLSFGKLGNAKGNGADFSNANCSSVNFTNADLTDAILVKANLNDADLTDADLSGADVDGIQVNDDTKLSKAKNLTDAKNWSSLLFTGSFWRNQINSNWPLNEDFNSGLSPQHSYCGQLSTLVSHFSDSAEKGKKAKVEDLPVSLSEKLFLGVGIDLGWLLSAFMSVLTLGIGPLYVLYTNKFDEQKKIANKMSSMGIDYTDSLKEVFKLSEHDFTELEQVAIKLDSKLDRILDSLERNRKSAYVQVAQLPGYAHVEASGGDIYLVRGKNGEESKPLQDYLGKQNVVKIMDIRTLLSYCKKHGFLAMYKGSIEQNKTDLRIRLDNQAHSKRAKQRYLFLDSKDLSNIDLSNMAMVGWSLNRTKLNNSNLSGTNMRYTEARGMDLSKANLCNADLTGANLVKVNLCGAQLMGTNLDGSTITLKFANDFGSNQEAYVAQYSKTIASIDDKYAELKANLHQQLHNMFPNLT